MQNIYGKKGYESITADLRKALKQQINKYEDKDALKILETE